jgi:sodium-dependent dicarboxylate transporter 2/3/5
VVYPVSDVAGSGREAVAEERRRMGPMTVPQKRMALLFAATAALWVFRADLRIGALEIPGWSRLFMGAEASDPTWYAQHKNDISDATVATLLGILAFVIPSGWRGGEVDGAPETSAEGGDRRFLMDWRTASRLPWDVLLLLGGGFCLAHAFKVSGLDAVLGGALAPILEGQSSWLVVAAVCVLVAGLTEITSNTATTAVLLPVMASAASTAGLDPMVVMLPATLAASAAFMMPVATPPNAVVFATHRVPMTRMARAGIWMNLLMAAIITLVFQLWSKGLLGVSDSVPDWAR